jgi:hypothetical protein
MKLIAVGAEKVLIHEASPWRIKTSTRLQQKRSLTADKGEDESQVHSLLTSI